jgi:hypothetical protein
MKLRAFFVSILFFFIIMLTRGLGEAGSATTSSDYKVFLPLLSGPNMIYSLGVYYYPWYFSDFHGRQYLREHLIPRQEPVLGEYNDRQESVIGQHLEWSRYAGIDLWVTSWWGPGSAEDITILNHILRHSELDDNQIAIYYETTGRTENFTDYSKIGSDIAYLAANYFDHPNYFKIDGKPVLFVYLTRVLSQWGMLESTLETMHNAAAESGSSLYVIGDHCFGSPSHDLGDIVLLDAITNYDVYGSMGATGFASQSTVDSYYAEQAQWQAHAISVGTSFIPAVTPGFNDKGVRAGHDPLSRKLGSDREFGSLFTAMIRGAKEQTDAGVGNLIMITSWNEWHEDTQIEPVKVAPPTDLDDSDTGIEYTTGLSYEGYGQRYLEILRNEVLVKSR